MIELLLLAILVTIAYALGQAHDERDQLLLRLHELQSLRARERHHWQPVAQELEAERAVWRQVAAVQQATRHAMCDAVRQSSAPRPTTTPQSAPSVRGVGERHRRAMAAAGLTAKEVQATVKRRRR